MGPLSKTPNDHQPDKQRVAPELVTLCFTALTDTLGHGGCQPRSRPGHDAPGPK